MLCLALETIWNHFTRPVHPSIRRLWTRFWRHLWTDLHQIWNIASLYLTEKKIIEQFSQKLYTRMRDHQATVSLQLSKFAQVIDVVFTKLSCFCVDYFNKMAELVPCTVFNTRTSTKKLTECQKCRKSNDFRQTNVTLLKLEGARKSACFCHVQCRWYCIVTEL